MQETVFSTSYETLPNGGTRMVVATLEDGVLFQMELGPEETINNLKAWAAAAGLSVAMVL